MIYILFSRRLVVAIQAKNRPFWMGEVIVLGQKESYALECESFRGRRPKPQLAGSILSFSQNRAVLRCLDS